MALQQPNFAVLAQHLAGVVHEVQFIPNAPIAHMANVPNLLAQMQQQLNQIQQQTAQTQQQTAQIQQQLNQVGERLDEL